MFFMIGKMHLKKSITGLEYFVHRYHRTLDLVALNNLITAIECGT